MKKLLIIGSNTIHVYNYIELVKEYFDDILLVSDEKREGSSVRTEIMDFHLKFSSRIGTVKKLKKVIADYSPSIIHVHQANSYAYYALKAAKNFKIPKVLTAWGSDILLLPQKSWLLKKMVQFNLRHADAFTSDSEFMALEMRRLVPNKNLNILIANFGIEVLKMNFPKENIIYSNRLHKKLYRIDKIIDGFKRFLESTKDKSWKLVIAATGDETESLKKKVDDLGLNKNVHFAGWMNKEQNAEYYSKAKIFVSIPESDATAISLLEAMAYGCIPVLSNLPANREWIMDDENGIIVKSLDENYLERGVNLISDVVASTNKLIIAERGTKKANREKFIHLYDKLLNE